MKGKFKILKDNQYYTYTDFDDIPMEFDNLVEFRPDFIEGPHTQEQHDEIETYPQKLKELLKRGKLDHASSM